MANPFAHDPIVDRTSVVNVTDEQFVGMQVDYGSLRYKLLRIVADFGLIRWRAQMTLPRNEAEQVTGAAEVARDSYLDIYRP